MFITVFVLEGERDSGGGTGWAGLIRVGNLLANDTPCDL